jgi:hypothetical protein
MTKRDELAAWLPESVVDAWHAEAARLRVTMAPAGDGLNDETRAWLDASAADMAASLAAVEADLPPGQVGEWIDAMWQKATPVRFDEATGELVEVQG